MKRKIIFNFPETICTGLPTKNETLEKTPR